MFWSVLMSVMRTGNLEEVRRRKKEEEHPFHFHRVMVLFQEVRDPKLDYLFIDYLNTERFFRVS